VHILFLTDNFPPEVNAPASRTFEHCREWVRAGHRVTVITCVPNFPHGRVYPRYRNKLWQSEVMAGIRVIRVWSYITANEGFLRRIMDYISYMAAAVVAAPWVRGVDVVIGTSPQFFTACAAFVVSRCKRIPFVFELRDIWPESIKAVGAMTDSVVIRWLEKLELFLYRQAAAIVAVTESFKRTLVARGVPADKIHVVTNGVDINRFKQMEPDPQLVRQYGLEGKFVAGYVGTHGMAHALETVLQAADMLRRQPGGDVFHFLLLGDGARKSALQDLARELHLDNVHFIASVAKKDVALHWSLLDVSIIHLKRTVLFTSVIPSKMFECMGMGIPVLHGVAGESADIVRREGVGLVFEPENARQLCALLLQVQSDADLRQQLRQACLRTAPRYDRAMLAEKMLVILHGVIRSEQKTNTDN